MKQDSVTYQWINGVDQQVAGDIVLLINCSVADGGTLGYEHPMNADDESRFIAGLREDLSSGRTRLLLGRADFGPAFMAQVHLNRMANCRHRAELSKGVVHPAYRGMNLVKTAFEEIVLLAESLGIQQLTLDVREGTRAHRLWQLFGFETYGVLEDYARAGGVTHRGHFMVQAVEALRQKLATASPSTLQRIQ